MNTSSLVGRHQLDWNLLRCFLAVVDAGSLTGATRMLSSSQPTLSRQIAELEQAMGVALFERVARGLRLTAAGETLLPYARQMQQTAHELELATLGQTQELKGTVRVTACEMTSCYLLPPILAQLMRRHPEIQIELAVSNEVENLLERKADVAIRMVRPQQSGLIARHIADAAMGAYAHADYLGSVGGMVDMSRADSYCWLGFDTSDRLIRGFREGGVEVEREFFDFRSDNRTSGWQLALAGAGIAFTLDAVAARYPQMRPALPPGTVPALPVWVIAHRELRQSARIRVVFDTLAEGLQAVFGARTHPL